MRSFIITFLTTPNPDSLAFTPEGVQVLPAGMTPIEFQDLRGAKISPLAQSLFKAEEGIKRVFLTSDFITVTKDEEAEWDRLKPIIVGTITQFYSSGEPVINSQEAMGPSDTDLLPTDSEDVAKIKELIELKVRPALEADNGGIIYHGYVEGVVFVQLIGSCDGCSSSTVTLKNGVERMLMHWVEGVKGLMAVESAEEYRRLIGEDVEKSAFEKLEEKLGDKTEVRNE